MATSFTKVTEVDHGYKRAQKLLKQPRLELRLGVLETEAAQPHPGGSTIGDVAWWMEFVGYKGDTGTPQAPRSWLFDWVSEHIDTIQKQLAADTYRVLFGGESEKNALKQRGAAYRKQVIGRIKRRIPPRNHPRTLAHKQGDVPLIDTKTFINAIRYEVV